MFVDPSHESVIELMKWLEGLSEVDRELVEADMDDLLEKAALGRIPQPVYESLVRVGIDPTLLELRWRFRGLGSKGRDVAVRQYHAEPAAHPHILLALHRHIKSWRGLTKAQTKERQETEMRYAKFRYLVGLPREWK